MLFLLQKASDTSRFTSNTGQSDLPAFPDCFHSPITQEWRMGWLKHTLSCWTLGWNLAHSWEAVDTSYMHHAALSYILPTLLAKEEEWTEEIWLKPIFIQFMWLQQQTQKWKEGNQEEQIQASVLCAADAPGPKSRHCNHQHIFCSVLFFVVSFLMEASVPGHAQQNSFTACSF